MESTSVIVFSAIIIIVAVLIGFLAGNQARKRQGAESHQEEVDVLDLSGLPIKERDAVVRYCKAMHCLASHRKRRLHRKLYDQRS